jgi:hypothetical protein
MSIIIPPLMLFRAAKIMDFQLKKQAITKKTKFAACLQELLKQWAPSKP